MPGLPLQQNTYGMPGAHLGNGNNRGGKCILMDFKYTHLIEAQDWDEVKGVKLRPDDRSKGDREVK